MKICHKYRNLIDSSFNTKINMQDWSLYSEYENCDIFSSNKNDKKMAIKKVKGLYAHEIASRFWNIDDTIKLEWDQSIQSMKILEQLSPNCAVIHLKMKRVWPAKARDCVICTEILQIADNEWVVNNISVDYPIVKVSPDYTRMSCNINMFVKEDLIDKTKSKTRDNIISTISYRADVDVGTWVSNAIVSAICHKTWVSTLDDLCNTIKKQ